jgi:Tol biopolymer transport system component/predicted Ser/Thr protein kinase
MKPKKPSNPELQVPPASEANTVPPQSSDMWGTRMPRGASGTEGGADASSYTNRPLPAEFGRYRLLKLLGKGNMGAVYLAHDYQLDRKVALKIPNLGSDADPALKERFFREARSAATLLHANICPIYDVSELDGVLFLTMGYLEGRPLADLIEPGRKQLTQRQIAAIVRKLALALDVAHQKGIIHRDLKPANIMINKQGEPIIMDFGLARRSNRAEATLTQTGDVMGTPAYMAPEQARGATAEIGPGCDIYSLGVILYEMLCGQIPFTGDTPMEVLAQLLVDKPKPPSTRRRGVHLQLEAICLKALSKTPAERQPSMAAFAAGLNDYLKGTIAPPEILEPVRVPPAVQTAAPPAARKTQRPEGRRPAAKGGMPAWAWALIGAAGAAVLAIVVVLLIFGRRGDAKKPSVETGVVVLDLGDTPEDLLLLVDGKPTSLTDAARGLSLPTGRHTLSATSSKTQPFSTSFEVRSGGRDPLPVHLTPLLAPLHGQLLYSVRQGSSMRLFLLNLAGGEPILISDQLGSDESPAWSKDGSHVAFISFGRNNVSRRELYLADFDGQRLLNPRALAGPTNINKWEPTWLPDDKRIAFQAPRGPSIREIWAVSIDSPPTLIQLSKMGANDKAPSWSPDGRKLVFSSQRTGSAGFRYYVQDLVSGEEKQLSPVDNPVAYASAAWSPNSEQLVYSEATAGIQELVVSRPDGSDKRQLTQMGAHCSWPSWSPDGKTIAFVCEKSGRSGLYVIGADGKDLRFLNISDAFSPVWKPEAAPPG